MQRRPGCWQGTSRGNGRGGRSIGGGRSEERGGETRVVGDLGGDQRGFGCLNRGVDYKVDHGLLVKEPTSSLVPGHTTQTPHKVHGQTI